MVVTTRNTALVLERKLISYAVRDASANVYAFSW